MKLNSIIKLTIVLILFSFARKAYSNTYSIGVGETLTLNIPPVSLGYVDKAIWACSNPAISFISKSTQSAKITALTSFEGYATIELLYVEKYVDSKGFTRSITYTKNYYISCKAGTSGGGSSIAASSISVEPEIKVAIGNKAKIHYQLYPKGSTAEIWVSYYPGQYFNSITHYKESGYVEGIARSPGVEDVDIYFYNEKNEKVSSTCKVIVYDPTWIEPRSINLQKVLLLTVGETKKLLPSFTPSSATALYEWSSDNSSIISVSDGSVKAKSAGIANITLKTSNGLISQCTVIVMQNDTKIPGLNKALNRAADMLKNAENENIK